MPLIVDVAVLHEFYIIRFYVFLKDPTDGGL